MSNNELANINYSQLRKITTEEKVDSIKTYFTNFIANQNIKDKDKVNALFSMFEALGPKDADDAIICANIINVQRMIGELNEVSVYYGEQRKINHKAMKHFQWAQEKIESLSKNLVDMVNTRKKRNSIE